MSRKRNTSKKWKYDPLLILQIIKYYGFNADYYSISISQLKRL